jgi:hypothetical protein
MEGNTWQLLVVAVVAGGLVYVLIVSLLSRRLPSHKEKSKKG